MDRFNTKCLKIKELIYNKLDIIQLIFMVISTVSFIIGLKLTNYNVMLIAIFIIFLINVLQGIINIKKNIYYLMFNFIFFVFILSRPIISMFRKEEWWYFEANDIITSLVLILFSLIFINLGYELYNYYKESKQHLLKKISLNKKNIILKDYHVKIINIVLSILFLISFLCTIYIEVDKYIFMYGKDYEQYYMIYKNNLPYLIRVFSSILEISMTILLILRPNKKKTILILSAYIVTNVPMLLIGERGSIIKAILFSFLYFCFRNFTEKKEIWIGKIEKIIVIMGIPVAIIGLGAYNYIRANETLPSDNIFNIGVDFFLKQGVTFDVLCIGNSVKDKLPDKNYTFGPFIEYFKYNIISQKLFNIKTVGQNNSIYKATQGNDYAHAMSYITREDYLQGHGWGSSYILEVYSDYGYIGIIMYNIILGAFLGAIIDLLQKKNIISIITLYSTLNLFMIPRASATAFLIIIVNIKFILILLFLWLIIKIVDKFRLKTIYKKVV